PHATAEYDPFAGDAPFAEPPAPDADLPPDRRSRRSRHQESAEAFMERHNLFGAGNGGSGGRRRWVVPAIGLIIAVIGLWFLFSLFEPFKGDGGTRVTV